MNDIILNLFGGAIWLTIVLTVLRIVFYLCKAVGLFFLCRKTNQKHSWLAFIPIVQDVKVFNLAGLNSIAFALFYVLYRALYSAQIEGGLLMLVAWIGIVLHLLGIVLVRYQMAINFGMSEAMCVLNIIFEPFVLLYLAFSNVTHHYNILPYNFQKILFENGMLVNRYDDEDNF